MLLDYNNDMHAASDRKSTHMTGIYMHAASVKKFTHMTGIFISDPKGIYEQCIISAPGCQIYTNDTFVISTSKIDLTEIDCSIFP